MDKGKEKIMRVIVSKGKQSEIEGGKNRAGRKCIRKRENDEKNCKKR
jgi:hypothetical protein